MMNLSSFFELLTLAAAIVYNSVFLDFFECRYKVICWCFMYLYLFLTFRVYIQHNQHKENEY